MIIIGAPYANNALLLRQPSPVRDRDHLLRERELRVAVFGRRAFWGKPKIKTMIWCFAKCVAVMMNGLFREAKVTCGL